MLLGDCLRDAAGQGLADVALPVRSQDNERDILRFGGFVDFHKGNACPKFGTYGITGVNQLSF